MKKIRILSIDGGGIRGVIPATIVEYIEDKLQEFSNNPNARIADYFDMIVGTSTGGILTCFYLVPNHDQNGVTSKYTAKQALEFYSKYGYSIFNKSKRRSWFGLRSLVNATQYSPKTLEKIFLEKFGDLKMHELLKKSLVTSYCMGTSLEGKNLKGKSAVFFDSFDKPSEREFFVRDVVRSTSAAPTYFPPAKVENLANGDRMTNIDGGVFANNPSMCAYSEARRTPFETHPNPSASGMLLLSLGTGGGQFSLPPVKNSKKWGVLNWAKSIPEIMMDGSIDTVNHQMLNLFATLKKEHQFNYKRIDVAKEDRNYSSDMADASPENIKKLKHAGKLTLNRALKATNESLGLDDFIKELIKNGPDS